MQSAISIEQEIINGIRALPASKQQEVLDFVDFLRQRATPEQPENRLSMQEVARLPVRERHQYLKQYIPAMVDDFAHDPALTEFSELDMDDWAVDDAQS
ncbi:MAG: hypothetical protein WA885_24100 [Phormidesmis sp.]